MLVKCWVIKRRHKSVFIVGELGIHLILLVYQIVPIHFSFVLSHLLTKEKLSGGGGSKEFYCYA
jgi:hypothetical protein